MLYQILGTLIALLLGSALGSYIAAQVTRSREHRHHGNRSQCSHCTHHLPWYDLIPVWSGLLLQGRCRYCNAPFGYRHVVTELLLGLCFAVTWLVTYPQSIQGQLIPLGIGMITSYLAISTSAYDMYHRAFPVTGLTLGSMLCFAGALWTGGASLLLTHMISSTILIGILGSIVLTGTWIRKPLMGSGDVYLGLFVGSILPPLESVITLTFGSVLGVLIGSALLMQGKTTSKTALPFAPFLMSAAWIMLLLL